MTDRDRFLAAIGHLPFYSSDVIAVFCGEDTEARLEAATHTFRSQAAPRILLLGGRDEPPAVTGAERAFPMLMGMGVAPDRILIETESRNTREQAVALVTRCLAEQWGQVLLVASSYHLPRAYLTTVRALADADALDKVRLVPAAARHSAWGECPPGMTSTRLALLKREVKKIVEYRATAHCASYTDGLDYLLAWEGK